MVVIVRFAHVGKKVRMERDGWDRMGWENGMGMGEWDGVGRKG